MIFDDLCCKQQICDVDDYLVVVFKKVNLIPESNSLHTPSSSLVLMVVLIVVKYFHWYFYIISMLTAGLVVMLHSARIFMPLFLLR